MLSLMKCHRLLNVAFNVSYVGLCTWFLLSSYTWCYRTFFLCLIFHFETVWCFYFFSLSPDRNYSRSFTSLGVPRTTPTITTQPSAVRGCSIDSASWQPGVLNLFGSTRAVFGRGVRRKASSSSSNNWLTQNKWWSFIYAGGQQAAFTYSYYVTCIR